MMERAWDGDVLAARALEYQVAEMLYGVGLNAEFPEYSAVDPRETFFQARNPELRRFIGDHFPWEESGEVFHGPVTAFRILIKTVGDSCLRPLGFVPTSPSSGMPSWRWKCEDFALDIEFNKPPLSSEVMGWMDFPGLGVRKTLSYWALFSGFSLALNEKTFDRGLRHYLEGFHTIFPWLRDELAAALAGRRRGL